MMIKSQICIKLKIKRGQRIDKQVLCTVKNLIESNLAFPNDDDVIGRVHKKSNVPYMELRKGDHLGQM